MTNEEAAKELMMAYEDLKHMCYMDCGREVAFNKAIEALKAEPCEDCDKWETDKTACQKCGEPCEDCVSREAALKALWELPHEYKTKEQRARTGGIAACQTIVRELPPVTPKPRTGKWIDKKPNLQSPLAKMYWCDQCGAHAYKSAYCPGCGAKMEGESE